MGASSGEKRGGVRVKTRDKIIRMIRLMPERHLDRVYRVVQYIYLYA